MIKQEESEPEHNKTALISDVAFLLLPWSTMVESLVFLGSSPGNLQRATWHEVKPISEASNLRNWC